MCPLGQFSTTTRDRPFLENRQLYHCKRDTFKCKQDWFILYFLGLIIKKALFVGSEWAEPEPKQQEQ